MRRGLDTSAAAKSVFSVGDESKKGQMGCEMVRGGPRRTKKEKKEKKGRVADYRYKMEPQDCGINKIEMNEN